MKTNVNIIRKLNEFEVIQRTKDGMFNATELLKQWNKTSGQKKDVSHYFSNDATKQLIDEMKADHGITGTTDNELFTKVRGGQAQGTWMHPYLFIDFAMWLNPKFKLQVIKFVYDELIKHRNLSGEYYNKLCSAIAKFDGADYRETGRILNFVVFNKHEKQIRNSATPEQQNDLQQLERDLCNYIENGFIKSFEQFKEFMREQWRKRHLKYPGALAIGV